MSKRRIGDQKRVRTAKRKPPWLTIPIRHGGAMRLVEGLQREEKLHTVCEAANCPNRMECYSRKTLTFMILGAVCTRDCAFCKVSLAKKEFPGPVDQDEPARIAKVVDRLRIAWAVITSVTRDDLPDGGANHFVAVARAIRALGRETKVEFLIPDFQGDKSALEAVLRGHPDVLNHNVETVPRLYQHVRPQADYCRSLELLRRAKDMLPTLTTKSGLMVGLGEREEEILRVMNDLRSVGCDIITVGQYLSPSPRHLHVHKYISPDRFAFYREEAKKRGFRGVAAYPFARSSYRASEIVESRD